MKKTCILGAALAILGTATLWADDTIDFNGYIRAGLMLDHNLNNSYAGNASQTKEPFVINDNLVGRLGNEADQYFDVALAKKIVAEDGSWAKMNFQLSGWYYDFDTPASTTPGTVATTYTNPYVSQLFVEMGGFSFDPKSTYWVGQRYYGREDIHIDDFKWRDLDGAGVGVEGLLGGNLDVALMTTSTAANESSPTYSGNGAVPLNVQVRYKLTKSLVAEVLGAYTPNTSGIQYYNTSVDANAGVQGSVTYWWDQFFGLPVGYSTVALQAGEGMYGYGFTTTVTKGSPYNGYWSQLGKLGNAWAYSGSQTYRFVADGVATLGDWDIGPAFWAEFDPANSNLDDANTTNQATSHWVLSGVVRPVYKLTKNFSLAFEGGVADQIGGPLGYAVDGSGGRLEGVSYKITFAPTLALDSGFTSRPQLRAFVTYEGQDAKLGPVDANGNQAELKFGVQTEVWW